MKDKIKEILIDVYQIDGRLEDEAAERILRLFSVSGNCDLENENPALNKPVVWRNFSNVFVEIDGNPIPIRELSSDVRFCH